MSFSVALTKNSRHLQHSDDTHRIDFDKVDNHLRALARKYARGIEAWERNEGKTHPHNQGTSNIAKAGDKDSEGVVALKDIEDNLWTGIITFGGQDIHIDFDTGSSDTVVNKTAYTPGKTAHKTDVRWKVGYGDGTKAEGSLYLDVLNIAGLPPVAPVAIGWADTDFIQREDNNRGISGLAFPSLARFGYNHPPFFDRLLAANVLKQPLFSFLLSKDGAELTIGEISKKVKGEPYWGTVNPVSGFWSVSNTTINGTKINVFADTGTTLIIGPVAAVEKLFKQLGVEIYKQKGSTYGLLEAGKKAPEINIAVGDKKITLNDETAIFGKDDKGKSILSIVGEDLGYGDVWILGDAWLRNFVSIWDRGQNRFGIADIVKNAK